MQYVIVTANDKGELEKLVSKLLDQSWQPTGGIATSVYEIIDYHGNKKLVCGWSQAMIRHEIVFTPVEVDE